jgi:cysteinyl-tRNA synthetase
MDAPASRGRPMQLKLYDTLTRKKRDFVPLDWERDLPESERRVRMYVCGPTVYDFAHIGNARPVIVFDVLFRLLRHLYGAERVVYVRNITDVDDRINARAAELRISIRDLTERTYRDFREDVAALGCLSPTFEPRATEYIEPMQAMIERLIRQGNAYVAEEHVLFHVPSMPDYGQLSKRPLDEMIAGARVEVAPFKRNPMDFVLWKPSKPGEPAWPSPAGIATPGRPGWHIECSAMAWRHLGEMFDIHGGGIDLEFPHHENEIAQSRSAFHTPLMARFWVHNGFLQLEGEKMAKSVGNVVTIRELLENWNGSGWSGEILRFNMLRTHYHQPIDWTLAGVEESQRILRSWYEDLPEISAEEMPSEEIIEALYEDLNTPEVITRLHRLKHQEKLRDLRASLRFLGFSGDKDKILRRVSMEARIAISSRISVNVNVERYPNEQQKQQINALIAARDKARKERNFAEADRIREELRKMRIVLKDSKDGTTWDVGA